MPKPIAHSNAGLTLGIVFTVDNAPETAPSSRISPMPNCATPILIPRIHVAALVLVDEASCEVLEDWEPLPRREPHNASPHERLHHVRGALEVLERQEERHHVRGALEVREHRVRGALEVREPCSEFVGPLRYGSARRSSTMFVEPLRYESTMFVEPLRYESRAPSSGPPAGCA